MRACILFVVSPRVPTFIIIVPLTSPTFPPPPQTNPGLVSPMAVTPAVVSGSLIHQAVALGDVHLVRRTYAQAGRGGSDGWGRVMGRGVCFGSFFLLLSERGLHLRIVTLWGGPPTHKLLCSGRKRRGSV